MEPDKMTLKDLLDALSKYCDEHDLDCEEGGPRDRCTACLSKEAKRRWELER